MVFISDLKWLIMEIISELVINRNISIWQKCLKPIFCVQKAKQMSLEWLKMLPIV